MFAEIMDFSTRGIQVFRGVEGTRGMPADFPEETVKMRISDLLEPDVGQWKRLFQQEMASLALGFEEGHYSLVAGKRKRFYDFVRRLSGMGAPVDNATLAKAEDIFAGAESRQEAECGSAWN